MGKGMELLTERARLRREEYIRAKPKIMPERSRIFIESWKETEDEDIQIRYAKAFEKIMRECPIVIREKELIVGSIAIPERGCYPSLEWQAPILKKEFEKKQIHSMGITVICECDEKARKSILEDCEFWAGKTPVDKIMRAEKQLYKDLPSILYEDRIASPFWQSPPSGRAVDHPRILAKGLSRIIAELEEEMNKIKKYTAPEMHKYNLLRGGIISCKGVIEWARRYARLARELAAKEGDALRKKELKKIGEICDHVPAEPARNFYEALQSWWITLLATELEGCSVAPTVGRVDQHLYPYYTKDIEGARINKEEVIELLTLFIIKLCEIEHFSQRVAQEVAESSHLLNVTIGGVKADGSDATNELSFLILEAARRTQLPTPHISLRYHDKINHELLLKAAECNRDIGGGIPAFFNDRVPLLRLTQHGLSVVQARDWIPVGCVESYPYRGGMGHIQIMFNLTKIFELALNNGVDPRTGKQIGPRTGNAREFISYEQVHQSLVDQLASVIECLARITNVGRIIRGESYRQPYSSIFIDNCVEKGLDACEGGLRMVATENAFLLHGHQNTANSLAAIKKVVFEDKKVSMDQLLDALAANFEGYEELQQLLLTTPKWGNDDDYVDDIMVDLWKVTEELVKNQESPWNTKYSITRQGLTLHHHYGQVVGALPDGRKAFEPTADGSVSAMRGTDKKGITAVINSASKLDYVGSEASLFNLKLSPALLQTTQGVRNFISLVKTYFDRGGYHVQFNMLDRGTLVAAKKNPQQYRNLMVRVAGYSAFFVELSPHIQDEIIARMEYQAI